MVRARHRKRVITIAATKGGVGKTTLTSALAVRASQESNHVLMIDVDKQNSLRRWWYDRKEPGNPKLLELNDLSDEGLGLVVAEEFYDWLLVDTPPAQVDAIMPATRIADLVVIPVRASTMDVDAVVMTIQICLELEKPYVFLLNAVNPKNVYLPAHVAALREKGELLDPMVTLRDAYVNAIALGKTGPEIERGPRTCTAEIDAVWNAIKAKVQ